MPTRSETESYAQSVFINCPFDNQFFPVFQAITFAVAACGFIPRCALESSDSGQVRIQKIMDIIAECRYGIHDLSRIETSQVQQADGRLLQLPRFNMPLELGLFMGAGRYGGATQRSKKYLVQDSAAFRYQQFVSDLAGQDIQVHGWQPEASENERQAALLRVISNIRNWLAAEVPGRTIPGGTALANRYQQFRADLPELAAAVSQREAELTFFDFTALIQTWLQ